MRFLPRAAILTASLHYASSTNSTRRHLTKTHLAWMMSYPGSGSHYVRQAVQESSQTTTATNYEADLIHAEAKHDGPYRYTQNLPFPPKYLLTDTHCSGYCQVCIQNKYLHQSMFVKDLETFYSGCSTGYQSVEDNLVAVNYGAELVRKVVVLIRDPFQNMVARFMDDRERCMHRKMRWNYAMDPNGFREWCKESDYLFNVHKAKRPIGGVDKLDKSVPCHGLFYQYVLWHNSVHLALEKYGAGLDVHLVHYEDFWETSGSVISNLFQFLELPTVNPPPSLQKNQYDDYFTPVDRRHVGSFVKDLASPPSWDQLKHYVRHDAAKDNENNWHFSERTVLTPDLNQGAWPEVAWLLTFPSSGSSYIARMIMYASQSTIATNYASDVPDYKNIPDFSYTENGPFRVSGQKFPKDFIITKTHCVGHCVECKFSEKLIEFQDFVKGCGKVLKVENDHGHTKYVTGFYDPTIVKKIIHVVRDPIDNIVSRFHNSHKFHSGSNAQTFRYPKNRDGFRDWCRDSDRDKTFLNTYSKELQQLAADVPCHNFFHQYVRWHDNAFQLPKELGLYPLVVHNEDFHHDLEETTNKLLLFLGLYPRRGLLLHFNYRTYHDYVTMDERVAIDAFVKEISSEITYENLKRYFLHPVVEPMRRFI